MEGTFPPTNHATSLYFYCFKRPPTHMPDALENVFAQREIIFTHRLTPDESIVVRQDLRSCTCS